MKSILENSSLKSLALAALILIPASAYGQGTLFVEGDKVGVGVATPVAKLHVKGTDGATQLLVQEKSGAEAARTVLNIENNGVTIFRATDISTDGSSWTFQAEGPSFRFNKAGTGASEVLIRSRNDSTGGLPTFTVDGSIQADNVTFTSSRSAKSDFAVLDPVEVLEKVIALPVGEWSFRDEENGRRHIGPVAEDFAELFPLGGNQAQISVIDANGVAIASIQGLYNVLREKDEAIEQLKATNADLKRRLEDLEAAVAALNK